MAIGVMVPNGRGNLDVRQHVTSVAQLEAATGFDFGLPSSVATANPDLREWPTRVVRRELLGKLPAIDVQCPVAQGISELQLGPHLPQLVVYIQRLPLSGPSLVDTGEARSIRHRDRVRRRLLS